MNRPLQNPAQQAPRPTTYDKPTITDSTSGIVYRVDWCFQIGQECGEPAAKAFCKRNGDGDPDGFVIDENIGATQLTWTLGTEQVCNNADCDGFLSITCKAVDAPAY